jgi:hypothetical protein
MSLYGEMKKKLVGFLSTKHIEVEEFWKIFSSIAHKADLSKASIYSYAQTLLSHESNVVMESLSWSNGGQKLVLEYYHTHPREIVVHHNQAELMRTSFVGHLPANSPWNDYRRKATALRLSKWEALVAPKKFILLDEIADAKLLESEQRVVQWLQTTWRVLDGAFASAKNDTDKVFTGGLIFAELPSKSYQFVLQAFSLEFVLGVLEDKIALTVYDYKDQLHSKVGTDPVLSAEIKLKKSEVWDYLLRLLAKIESSALPM